MLASAAPAASTSASSPSDTSESLFARGEKEKKKKKKKKKKKLVPTLRSDGTKQWAGRGGYCRVQGVETPRGTWDAGEEVREGVEESGGGGVGEARAARQHVARLPEQPRLAAPATARKTGVCLCLYI